MTIQNEDRQIQNFAKKEKKMKQKTFNLVMVLMFVVAAFGINVQSVNASSNQAAGNSVFPGAIVCGTLHGWGMWRNTQDISTARTIYFEPSRTGTHRLQFNTYGNWPNGKMTPYWSNDNGKTWNSWSSVYFRWDTNIPITYLRTDTTKTIYKFVFSGGQKTYISYRFYCQ